MVLLLRPVKGCANASKRQADKTADTSCGPCSCSGEHLPQPAHGGCSAAAVMVAALPPLSSCSHTANMTGEVHLRVLMSADISDMISWVRENLTEEACDDFDRPKRHLLKKKTWRDCCEKYKLPPVCVYRNEEMVGFIAYGPNRLGIDHRPVSRGHRQVLIDDLVEVAMMTRCCRPEVEAESNLVMGFALRHIIERVMQIDTKVNGCLYFLQDKESHWAQVAENYFGMRRVSSVVKKGVSCGTYLVQRECFGGRDDRHPNSTNQTCTDSLKIDAEGGASTACTRKRKRPTPHTSTGPHLTSQASLKTNPVASNVTKSSHSGLNRSVHTCTSPNALSRHQPELSQSSADIKIDSTCNGRRSSHEPSESNAGTSSNSPRIKLETFSSVKSSYSTMNCGECGGNLVNVGTDEIRCWCPSDSDDTIDKGSFQANRSENGASREYVSTGDDAASQNCGENNNAASTDHVADIIDNDTFITNSRIRNTQRRTMLREVKSLFDEGLINEYRQEQLQQEIWDKYPIS